MVLSRDLVVCPDMVETICGDVVETFICRDVVETSRWGHQRAKRRARLSLPPPPPLTTVVMV